MASRVQYKTSCIPLEGITETIRSNPTTSWYLDSDCGTRPTSAHCTKIVNGVNAEKTYCPEDIITALGTYGAGENSGRLTYIENTSSTNTLIIALDGTNFTIQVLPESSLSFCSEGLDLNSVRLKALGGSINVSSLLGYA
tara:strand:- start:126 stop:545 length:420 start_codon:yes stop_codon:yes gene_type:complete